MLHFVIEITIDLIKKPYFENPLQRIPGAFIKYLYNQYSGKCSWVDFKKCRLFAVMVII